MSARASDRLAAWTLGSRSIPDGVRIEIAIPGQGVPGAGVDLTREEARAFAYGILADAGDATHRTFPHPPRGGDHG